MKKIKSNRNKIFTFRRKKTDALSTLQSVCADRLASGLRGGYNDRIGRNV